MLDMTRRELIALIGGGDLLLTVKVRRARAQQPTPVIGYLSIGSPGTDAARLAGLRQGLNEKGYVEGRDFVIDYRWAANQLDRLPTLAAHLVQPLSRPGLRPRLSQFCLESALIRCRSGLSRVSIDQEET
jgi:hypothetical protein